MKGTAEAEADICGHRSTIVAETADGREATFAIETTCDNITRFTGLVAENSPLDAFTEIDLRHESRVLVLGRESRCCTDCVVPAATLQALRVATGLALPADVKIGITTQ